MKLIKEELLIKSQSFKDIYSIAKRLSEILEIGDINQDELVNVDDFISLVAILMSEQEISEHILALGDINFDDKLDIYDLLLLADMI